MLTTLLIMLLIGSIIFGIILWTRLKEFETSHGTYEEFTAKLRETDEKIATNTEYLDGLNNLIATKEQTSNALAAKITELGYQEKNAIDRAAQAAALTEKDFELEAAKRRDEFERNLAASLETLKQNSPLTVYQETLKQVNAEIEQARQTLKIQQEAAMAAMAEEDFVNFHSITLTPADIKDIELIREFEPRLTRQEAFRKLVWTEFIQKPIQALCKVLEAEKVRGIYKITNTKNGRMYIGQAVDIAARWKDHCKTALGIGSSSFMTNKFYKAMHDEGIENFTFEILEAGDINLNQREFYWIDFYNATTFGYNSKAGA